MVPFPMLTAGNMVLLTTGEILKTRNEIFSMHKPNGTFLVKVEVF